MELPLVVGVDGSEGSLQALDWAVAEADRRGLPLRIVHASLWEHYEEIRPRLAADRPSEQVLAENLVATSEERANTLAAQVKVTTDVQPEEPVTALLREGDDAALLVVGSRGRGPVTAMLLGSVSLSVAARARCPAWSEARNPSTGPASGGSFSVSETPPRAARRRASRSAKPGRGGANSSPYAPGAARFTRPYPIPWPTTTR
ncbi:hypothetical protein GCM10011583_64030 [Streptomyces camponoticapitis]|uniref:UspA domain-containing protein n=1 Tax=Streptomyces camponoticapitis TaxID=1616125 RepID=A0ABQ2EV20_9ACTN|nr:hypothetical protein GCM10011583_64030 [Streptomyces camponoticapitis]